MGLSFSLSLFEAQRSAQQAVEPPLQGPQGGAAIVYQPDSSLDSDGPDDD